jgi:signal transduction histidine kinase
MTSAVLLALKGRSFTADAPGGEEILVAVDGLPAGPAVIRTFVPDAVLRHGVGRAWLLLGCVGLLLLVLSVAVADQLARSMIRPIKALAQASDRLTAGDLSARATVTGPPEVVRAGAGLNRLAVRIGELLAHERETVADLSHRLRTPLTALRIDAESLQDPGEMERLLADVGAVEHTVSEIIREARRPAGDGTLAACDAVEVIAERSAFWWPLAEDQERWMTVELPARCRSGCPGTTWRRARTSCWRTSSRTPRKARPSRYGSADAPGAARGWSSRTTGPASATSTPRSGACRSAAPPVSAWTSRGGSPSRQAAR